MSAGAAKWPVEGQSILHGSTLNQVAVFPRMPHCCTTQSRCRADAHEHTDGESALLDNPQLGVIAMRNAYVSTIVPLVAAMAFMAAFASNSASAAQFHYATTLSGAAESPANPSPATGDTLITIDTTALTMRVQANFSGLVGNTTASHVHCCTATQGTGTAGVATATPTFPGFPLGVTSGTYDQTFDMTLASSYNPAFVSTEGGVANAMADLFAGMAAGTAYFNIHTTAYPGGEIRGFPLLVPATARVSAIPTLDGWTMGLMIILLGATVSWYFLHRVRRNRW